MEGAVTRYEKLKTMVWFLWILFAIILYLISLWTFLECFRKDLSMKEALDVLKQAVFVTLCAGVSMAIDYFLFPTLDRMYFNGSPGYDVSRFLILPFVLLVASVVIGPTTPIRITKAPTLNRNKTTQNR